MSHVMENIGIGELRSNPVADQCLKCFALYIKSIITLILKYTGPRSAVGNVSGYRCEADCRSRGREFDPGPVPYFRGD